MLALPYTCLQEESSQSSQLASVLRPALLGLGLVALHVTPATSIPGSAGTGESQQLLNESDMGHLRAVREAAAEGSLPLEEVARKVGRSEA